MIERLTNLLLYDPSAPMLFNTGLFMVLFILFLGVYQITLDKPQWRKALVIAFSLYFYYKAGGAAAVGVLCGVCVSDWLLGMWLGREERPAMRRLAVGINVCVNVGMLVWFKYFNLLAGAFCAIVATDFEPLQILLPAGISFFTFRSISYMVDIYRRQMEPCRNLGNYAMFLTFFPPLLAGPVVRARDMLPQIEASPRPTPAMMSEGLFLIMTGLIKKVVIADYLGVNFVDRIFDNPALYSGFECLLGAVGFTVELYCDFSGYSDMAIGIALLLGYRFKDNFAAPFKSQSPTEFWRRWHISLSTWLRDYVYIPLGGNRCSRARSYFNQFITMVVGGLWHGASWMYLLWGAYHGVLLAAHKSLRRIFQLPEPLKGHPLIKFANVAVTFALVVAGFAIFRANSLESLGQLATQIFTDFRPGIAMQFVEGYMMIVAALALGYLAHMSPRSWTEGATRAYTGMGLVWQAALLAVVIFVVVQVRSSELVPFIYLQY